MQSRLWMCEKSVSSGPCLGTGAAKQTKERGFTGESAPKRTRAGRFPNLGESVTAVIVNQERTAGHAGQNINTLLDLGRHRALESLVVRGARRRRRRGQHCQLQLCVDLAAGRRD